MDDILDNLGLYKKPVPKEIKSVKIAMPKVMENVDINVQIIDKTKQEFDRGAIMAKIRKKQPEQVIPEEKTVVEDTREPSKEETEPSIVKPKPIIKIQKTGETIIRRRGGPRIIVGKSLKNTITGVSDITEEGKTKPTTTIKVKRRKGVKVRTYTEVAPSKIVIGDTLLSERLWPKEESINIRAPTYYMNNRKIFINFIDALFQKYRGYGKSLR